MQEQRIEQQARGSRETAGGNSGLATDSGRQGFCLPTLPPDYEARPLWGFSDDGGRIFAFHRVYRAGEPVPDSDLPASATLDQELSYWAMTWTTVDDTGDEFPTAQWITYAEARKLLGPHLTFTQFSAQLQSWLPALLHTQTRLCHVF